MGLWGLNATTFVKALKSAWPTVSAVCVFTVISSKASTYGFFVCFAALLLLFTGEKPEKIKSLLKMCPH